MGFTTEYEFELPRGYVDETGMLQKKGTMRLATAADEILPLRDPKVQQNPGYLTVVLLARVILNIGTVTNIDTKVIEKLFSADLAYLQNMYEQINSAESTTMEVVCPHCGERITVPINN